MAGIDRIKESILSEANAKVETILEEAKNAAKAMTDQAAVEADKIRQEVQDKADRSAKDYAGRIQSQIGMQQKQTILAAKQDLIRDVLQAAHEKLLSLPDQEYFKVILRLLDPVFRQDLPISWTKRPQRKAHLLACPKKLRTSKAASSFATAMKQTAQILLRTTAVWN